MISGIRSLSATHEQIILAWTGDIESGPVASTHRNPVPFTTLGEDDKQTLEAEIANYRSVIDVGEGKKKLNYVPVFLDDKVAHGHYEGYCKTSKWDSWSTKIGKRTN
jgi:trehalose 6-phosphate synthase/phosphatase